MATSSLSAILMVGVAVAGLSSGCEPKAEAPAPERWRLLDLAPVRTGDRFLVSPRFTADGRIEAASRGGLGRVAIDPVAGQVLGIGADRAAPAVAEDGFALLFDDGRRQVRWAPYSGEVQVILDAEPRVLEREDAWGVAVSARGSRVAWCTGHLPEARLRVVTADGRGLFAGPGAQPAWDPDGDRLVYVRPRAVPDASGRPVLAGAELGLLDLGLLDLGLCRATRLETPGVVMPMQPAFSPDGARLVLSDWATGHLLVGALVGTGGGP